MRLLLAPGTWSRADTWWKPGSLWVQALEAQGFEVVGLDWDCVLGGFGPERFRAWERAARQAADVWDDQPFQVALGHSHAMQALLWAVAEGWISPWVVGCVCGPVRGDLDPMYAEARRRLDLYGGRLVHWRGGRRDVLGLIGAFLDGRLSLETGLTQAHVGILERDLGHPAGEWFVPELWTARNWWRWLQA